MSTPSDDQPSSPAADPAPRPTRRVFSPDYKLAIVAEYENAPNGEKGAILRREGLYSSHVIEWRKAGSVPTSYWLSASVSTAAGLCDLMRSATSACRHAVGVVRLVAAQAMPPAAMIVGASGPAIGPSQTCPRS
ncbi:hypothetical protein [Saccharopolyspora hattusasensis]|uniref:hypothetical protein n=1 Tax=Saccharopolyspora hattusasensis TaxID=1128679 RepID=UPI003D97BD3C